MKKKISLARCPECCRGTPCDKAKLFLCVYNEGLAVEEVKPPTVVPNVSISHRIKVTCIADSEEIEIQLDPLSCSQVECATYDGTGQFVGGCEIGVISYGNDESCCETGLPSLCLGNTGHPDVTFRDETGVILGEPTSNSEFNPNPGWGAFDVGKQLIAPVVGVESGITFAGVENNPYESTISFIYALEWIVPSSPLGASIESRFSEEPLSSALIYRWVGGSITMPNVVNQVGTIFEIKLSAQTDPLDGLWNVSFYRNGLLDHSATMPVSSSLEKCSFDNTLHTLGFIADGNNWIVDRDIELIQ